MKIQRDTHSCGIYSVMNAARCLGIKLSKKRISLHTETTKRHGTNEKGILRALIKNGFMAYTFNFYKLAAFKALNSALKNDKPVIIYLPKEDHWCTVIGRMKDIYILFDSDNDSENKKEHGVKTLTKNDLKKIWKNNKYYYGIVVARTKKI